jgi:hypothetical protein
MTQPAVRHATYPGDQSAAVGQVKGPTTMGEYVRIVDADYDPASDRTRLGFTFAGITRAEATAWTTELAALHNQGSRA